MQSAGRVLDLLELVAEAGGEIGLSELAERSGIMGARNAAHVTQPAVLVEQSTEPAGLLSATKQEARVGWIYRVGQDQAGPSGPS